MAPEELRSHYNAILSFFYKAESTLHASAAREVTGSISAYHLMIHFAERVAINNLKHSINKLENIVEQNGEALAANQGKVTDYLLRSKDAIRMFYNLAITNQEFQPNYLTKIKATSLYDLLHENIKLLEPLEQNFTFKATKTWFSNPIRHGLRLEPLLMKFANRFVQITGSKPINDDNLKVFARIATLLNQEPNQTTDLPATKTTIRLVQASVDSTDFSEKYLTVFPKNLAEKSEAFKQYCSKNLPEKWNKEALCEVSQIEYPKLK